MALTTALSTVYPVAQVRAQEASTSEGFSEKFRAEHDFDIPAQALTDALVAFGQQSGIQVTVDGAIAQGVSASAVQGSMSAENALRGLLSGSGLFYNVSRSTVVIERITEGTNDATLLDPVIVEGRMQTATGPVDGYVATRSAAGSKTDTPLIETPQSVSVITRDQVEIQQAQSVTQSLRYTSGVVAEVRGSASRYDIPYIRGFGSPSDPVHYQDGLRMLRGPGYAFPQTETYGSERIEVLKGPSSTTYGSAMPGGLVNVVTKRPTEEDRGEIEFLVGSHARYQAAIDVSGPVMEDGSVLYRLVALGRDSETQVVNTKEQRVYLAPSLTWKAADDTTLTFLSHYQRDPEGGYYGILPTVGSVWTSPAGQIPRDFNDGDPAFSDFDREQFSVGYELEHLVNDIWTMRHNLRYLDVDVRTKDVATSSLQADNHTISRYALSTDEQTRGVTSDLQAQADFATGAVTHTTLLGFDYEYSDSSQLRLYNGNAPSIDYLNPVYGTATSLTLSPFIDQDQTIAQSGFYAQDQLGIGSWNFLLGGRFDQVRTVTDNNRTNVRQTQNDNAFSWKAGAVYNFDNGIAPYASYATSFLPVSGTDYLGDALDPTTAKQYEIGIKYEPQSFDAMFTLAYFDITQKDVVAVVNPVQRYQTGEVQSKGVELEAKVALSDKTNLIGNVTFTDAEVTKSRGYDVGDAPIAIPDVTASLWLDHSFDQGVVDGVTVGAGVRYVGETVGGYSPNAFTAGARRIDVPDYTLFDAMMRYDLGVLGNNLKNVSAQVNVTNLADETYATCLANNFCNYGNGRTVYVSLKYNW
ncbi:hypothetical protein LF95_23050 [Thalassospira sp. TSL5-1]|nr:hypothetical protein LF95_23050 [Thalassospira sp. TSL5-1]